MGGGAKAGKRLTQNQKRRLKKKLAKERAKAAEAATKSAPKAVKAETPAVKEEPAGGSDVVIEYVSENPLEEFLAKQRALAATVKQEPNGDARPANRTGHGDDSTGEGEDSADKDPVAGFAEQFGAVFARFAPAEQLLGTDKEGEGGEGDGENSDDDMPVDGESGGDSDGEEPAKLSRRQRKKLHRLSVAQLKQLVKRPDVVEAHDVTSSDPRLLVFLKAYRNTVPVPRHWCAKRKYLQGKRGIERDPFQLPDFIADTGITKIRDARNEEEEKKTSKQRQRDKMQPKMGKINIDYQILHDAFFKFQTKPKLTRHGDIYYEGKEFELQLQHKKPGHLSEALKQALGMPEGAPPPWLINMQRYGPPPAYPKLKIPGLNAPIPEGASFGYHPGGWGRPPVDEQGRPLYGDVFGTEKEEEKEVVDKTRWGVITPEESEEESEDESGDDDEEDEDDQDDAPDAGMATPMDGVATMASGLTTPATIDLRKGLRKGLETPETPQLYQVLQTQSAKVGSGTLMGSSHQYVLPGAGAGAAGTDSMELDALDDKTLQARFQATADGARTETSAAVEESRKKRKRKEEKVAEKNKRSRDKFKF